MDTHREIVFVIMTATTAILLINILFGSPFNLWPMVVINLLCIGYQWGWNRMEKNAKAEMGIDERKSR